MATTSKSTPQTLAGVRSIAVAGVSGKRTKFGSAASRELMKRGYEVYPVHPSLDVFEGARCYHSLLDLPTTPDCLLITTKPQTAGEIIDDAVSKGIRKVWFQQGADFSEAVARAKQAGLEVINKRCILMYAEPVGGIHKIHRFLSRLFGRY